MIKTFLNWVYNLINDNWPRYIITLDKNTPWFIDWIKLKNIIDFVYDLDLL